MPCVAGTMAEQQYTLNVLAITHVLRIFLHEVDMVSIAVDYKINAARRMRENISQFFF